MTCSVCGEGCHTTRDGKCIECIARCSCEEAMALRFELEKLRELCGETVRYLTVKPGEMSHVDWLAMRDQILARCAALGVEARR